MLRELEGVTNGEAFFARRLVITAAANNVLGKGAVVAAIQRHVNGCWGDLDEDDKRSNDEAVKHGGRILSSYKDSKNTQFWIVTEADRSFTTILLSEDY